MSGEEYIDGWRDTYCCKGCRSRRAGAGREHWGAPSSFPLPVSVTLPRSYGFSSSLPLLFFALPCFFSLILEKQPSSRREKPERPFGKKCQKAPRGPTGWQAREPKTERCVSVYVSAHERKQQAGDGHRRPLLGKGRSTHSLSLSLIPTHPSSLSLSILRECLICLARSVFE